MDRESCSAFLVRELKIDGMKDNKNQKSQLRVTNILIGNVYILPVFQLGFSALYGGQLPMEEQTEGLRTLLLCS